jgi:hypothetical protein
VQAGADHGRAVRGILARRPPGLRPEEQDMPDKSPRSHMTNKAKSIKQKRAEKHAKEEQKSHHEIIPPRDKR